MLEVSSESGEEFKPLNEVENSDTSISCKRDIPETSDGSKRNSSNDLICNESGESKSLIKDESFDQSLNYKQSVSETSDSLKGLKSTFVNQNNTIQKHKLSQKETCESKDEKLLIPKKPKEVLCATCRYKCSENFDEEYRQRICMEFWSLNYKGQKEFLISRVKNNKAQCRRARTGSRPPKTCSRSYYFLLDQKEVRVCKSFFLKTLGISHGPVETALAGINEAGTFCNPDRRGRKSPGNKTSDKERKNVNKHFQSTESDYCPKISPQKYLDQNLSVSKLIDVSMYVQRMFDPE